LPHNGHVVRRGRRMCPAILTYEAQFASTRAIDNHERA
jgi:hypothetical protein